MTAGPPRHSHRIAVVGGGIGGLAAAAFMRRAGLTATVYEQASALGEVGAGLIATPNAARLLRRLPSAGGLERAGVVLETGWEFRRWADGSVLFAQRLGEVCTRRYGEHTWTMHRADLLEVLRSAIPDEAVKLGRRCTSVTQDACGVTLTFSSGGPVRADVVVAADGIHSVLREHVTAASPPRSRAMSGCGCRGPAGCRRPAGAGSPTIIFPTGRSRWPGTRRSRARIRSATTTGSTATTPSTPPRRRRPPGEFSIRSAPHRDPGSTRSAFAGHIRR